MKKYFSLTLVWLLLASTIHASSTSNLYYEYRQSFKYLLEKELFKSVKANSCVNFKPIADSYYRLNKDGKALSKVKTKKKYIAEYYSYVDKTEKEFFFFKKNSKSIIKKVQKKGVLLDDLDLRSIILGSKIISPSWKIKEISKMVKYNLFRLELDLDLINVTKKTKEKLPKLKQVLSAKESLLIIKLAKIINVYGGKFFYDFESFFFSKNTNVKKMFEIANLECEHLLKEVNNVIRLATDSLREDINSKKKIGFKHKDIIASSCKYKKEYPLICRGYLDYNNHKRSSNRHKLGIPAK
jgi:hypothetical protein